MPKGKIYKVPVNKTVFQAIVHECGSSIIKLGACKEVDCTERTIRRALEEGKITPSFLDQIAKHLDVDSRLLAGELHRQAASCSNEFIRRMCLAQLKVGNYPYYRKRKIDLNKQPIEDLLEQILALFEISFSQFENMEFEEQYHLQLDLLEALAPVIRKHFKMDAYGRENMPDLEKVISDLENFREEHYLQVFAEEILRKEYLENPPPGKTKIDIIRMSPEALIDLDMYSGDED